MKDKSVGSVLKTETKVIGIVVICLVITVIGISYALFFDVKGNEKNQIVKAGTLEFSYANGSQITNATNSDCFIPMSMNEALKHNECEYKISITNTGTLPGNYNINLNSETLNNPLSLSKLKVILKKEGEVVSDYPKEGTTTSLVENEKIEAGSVINYSIQVYVDADNELLNADDDEKNIALKINGDAVVNGEELNPIMPATDYIKTIQTVDNGDGLYKVTHDDLEELGTEWNKTEYRYAGVDPDNYVSFNNELWRIIGLVNVKTDGGIEQRVKIVRTDGVGEQKDFGNYSWDFKLNGIGSSSSDYGSNDWTDSLLKDMLNGIYYTSEVGDCYKSGENGIPGQCDFTGTGTELSKGLDDTARNMVDKDVIWNLGGYTDGNITTSKFYEKERGTLVNTSIKRNTEWSKETDVGDKHNGIGLMYPSDYGYAVGGSVRSECLSYDIFSYYSYGCVANDWLKPSSDLWTLTPLSSYTNIAFDIGSAGYVYNGYNVYGSFAVWPTLYLKSSVKILPNSKQNQEYGSVDNPFILAN